MTPRVVPKDKRQQVREAERQALDRGVSPSSLLRNTPSDDDLAQAAFFDRAEGPDPYRHPRYPERSFFADWAVAADHDAAAGRRAPALELNNASGSLEQVRQRLEIVRQVARMEQRDLTSASNFMPASGTLPTYLADEFSVAARNAAVLAEALRSESLPPSGLTVTVPKTTTGTTAAVQTEAAAVSEQDPVTASASASIATVAGQVDASMQVLQRSAPFGDRWLAAELGAALGAAIDAELLNGTGAGHTLGLLNLVGITAITATTATAVGNLAAAGRLRADVAVAAGRPPDVLLAHPRRLAFIRATYGTAPTPLPELYESVVEVPAMPTTLSTNQDALIALVRDEVLILTSPPVIEVMTQTAPPTSVDTLTIRVRAYQYVALVPRQVTGIGKATGAGLVAPSWTA